MKDVKTLEYIKKCKEVHGDLYDYSKTIYTGAKNKVIIIDPDYGEFEQRAIRHKSGSGHQIRAKLSRRLTQEIFLKKCKEVHGNLYDYSKTIYSSMFEKVIIIDPDYGEFMVSPDNHIRKKSGHPRRAFDKNKLTTEQFIEKARKVHGDLYDYSKVVYVNSNTKIVIIDPIYGSFEQKACNHLEGQGNPKRAHNNLKYSIEEFIKKCNLIHNNFYDYSKVVYINTYTEIVIIDPELGDFLITPQYHLAGGGHPSRSYTHTYEVDHIIPTAFICKSKHRNKYKSNKLYQLLDSDINKKIILRTENRNKRDVFKLFGNEYLARNFRNDYELIRYLFLREHNLKLDDYICSM